MSENKKAFFGVDASKVEIKKLLNSEFLELSLKAISDEKPNRNDTWFTKESLELCKDTVYNKPVLGFFKNNDFVSHNGKWSKDEELDLEYWDTLGEGERCIGLIRESDDVEIIEDEKGLHWLTFSCAIWTQYSYKQVKRLLKDAIKAQHDGGPTKNISVEVNLTDYEDIYDPVSGKNITQINGFELVGVTILGSRNGVKVEPGIEGAELSVVDIIDTALFDKQVKNLRIAYEKLGDTKTNIIKEDTSMNVAENVDILPTVSSDVVLEEIPTTSGTTVLEENTTINENNLDNPTPEVNEPIKENFEENSEVVTIPVENVPTQPVEEQLVAEQINDKVDGESIKSTFEADPVCDLTWFIERSHGLKQDFESVVQYYKDHEVKGAEYILAIAEKQAKIYSKNCNELAATLAKVCAEDYVDNQDEIEHEKEMCDNCDCDELCSKLEAKNKECNELKEAKTESDKIINELETKIASYADYDQLKEKVKVYELSTLLSEAENYVHTAELSEESANQIYEDCKNGKYSSSDEVKTAVALLAFEAKPKNSVKTMYQAPIQTTPVVETTDDPETSKVHSKWDVLKDYNGNR